MHIRHAISEAHSTISKLCFIQSLSIFGFNTEPLRYLCEFTFNSRKFPRIHIIDLFSFKAQISSSYKSLIHILLLWQNQNPFAQSPHKKSPSWPMSQPSLLIWWGSSTSFANRRCFNFSCFSYSFNTVKSSTLNSWTRNLPSSFNHSTFSITAPSPNIEATFVATYKY